MKVEEIASIVHNLNRDYCKSIGDSSQLYWDEAPEWQKESAIEGVKDIIDNRTLTFEDQHKSWMDWKIAKGWKYGPVKDPDKKEHPCMVSYDELPFKDRLKDELFRNTVMTLLKLYNP